MNPNLPSTEDEARDYAIRHIRRLADRGYGPDQADAEAFMGCGGPADAGYDISRGKISIRNYYGEPGAKWTFSFRELAKSLTTPTQTAFKF